MSLQLQKSGLISMRLTFDIKGYQVIHTVREYKKGAGCLLYISNSVKYKVVKNLCYIIDVTLMLRLNVHV